MKSDEPQKAPAYQRYSEKWLVETKRLSWPAKGVYADLLEIIWIEFQDTCSIPNEDDYIAAELGCTVDQWQTAKKEIMWQHKPLFVVDETNRLVCEWMVEARDKAYSYREKMRENGKKGGRPKKDKKAVG